MKRLISILTVGLVLTVPLLTMPAYAASASLYLSPASTSVSQDTILVISIREDSGSEPVNAVQANLTYPADLLTFVSIGSSSAFRIAAQSSGGNGSVEIARGALPAVSGNQLVASVRFKAKVGSGKANISFASGSSVLSAKSNANVMTSSPGGNYSLEGLASAESAFLTANTRLDDVRLKACQIREKAVNDILSRIADRGQKQLNLFATIATRVENLYTDKGKKLSNYDSLVADVNAKKAAAQTTVNTVKAGSVAFKCDGSDPRGIITSFKDTLKSEITALQAYRTSVKNLIVGVKSVQGGN